MGADVVTTNGSRAFRHIDFGLFIALFGSPSQSTTVVSIGGGGKCDIAYRIGNFLRTEVFAVHFRNIFPYLFGEIFPKSIRTTKNFKGIEYNTARSAAFSYVI